MSDTFAPFCPGLAGRDLCSDCAGRIPEGAELRVLHHPWPFDPCPHYVRPEEKEAADSLTSAAAKESVAAIAQGAVEGERG